MAEAPEDTDKSISMGPAALMTCIDSIQEFSQQPVLSGPDCITPPKSNALLALENLSISSITSADASHAGALYTAFSPDAEFRPDILMSTINRQVSNSVEDLSISLGPIPALTEEHVAQPVSFLENEEPPDDYGSISMGPLPDFSIHAARLEPVAQERTITPLCGSSLAVKIEELDTKYKRSMVSPIPSAKSISTRETQTDVFQCQKCDELQHDYNQKLIEVANEFQRQYVAQLKLADQYAIASEESNKQIKDLMSQLEGADKQLKASRVFLEQQAMEREQEREEAIVQQDKLKALLTEKEKEAERAKESIGHLSSELQSIHESCRHKDKILEELAAAQQKMEQELQMLRISQADLEDENGGLHALLEVKEKLLKAQAEQITALHNELEHQLYAQSESERENELPAIERRREPLPANINEAAESTQSTTVTEVPSLFAEVQHLIVKLLRKVESSTRALETAQLSPKKRQAPSLLQSPRSAMTPSTSTEDVSIKDRNQNDVEDLRNLTPSPSDIRFNNDPERTINFLQQLDGKLAALNRIEEATCKRIADLEAELQRVSQSEKRSISKTKELEQQVQKHQKLMHDVEAEKRELQTEHVELMKRISSLENRLEEQRRSAVLGVTNNPHVEKCRVLSEEKQQLHLAVKEKEELMKEMQKEILDLHERIGGLMKTIQEKENESSRQTNYDISQASSIERLRDVPQHQDGSITWSKFQMPGSSPVAISPSPVPMHSTHLRPGHPTIKEFPVSPQLSLEVDDLKSKLAKSERQRTLLEDELASCNARLAMLEPLEKRNAALDDIIEQSDKEKAELQEKYETMKKDFSECVGKLKQLEEASEKLHQVEEDLTRYKSIASEFEAAQQLCSRLKLQQEEQKQKSDSVIDSFKKRCAELESTSTIRDKLMQDNEILKRKCYALEAEVATQQEVMSAMDALRQRYLQLQAEMVQVQQNSLQQASLLRMQIDAKTNLIKELQAKVTSPEVSELKTQSEAKDRAIGDLKAMLKLSESGKAKAEEALKVLQSEIDNLKESHRAKAKQVVTSAEDTQECTNIERPPAPPDLLAPSFIEFLGSTPSSRCSSSMGIAQRTIDSNTLIDCSLPNSMIGKRTLKQVQMAGQQLLSLGKQIAEHQKKANVLKVDQATSANPIFEDDLETTLKPISESGPSVIESQLLKKIELLETELEMERLLLQDQRATNARQQQQIIQLIAHQRLMQNAKTQQDSPRSATPLHSLKSTDVNKYLHYRALKLESMRKNLVYQKRFLSGILQELDPNHNKRISTDPKLKPVQRFRSAVFTVIAVERMRYVMRQWRHRRKLIENQSSS